MISATLSNMPGKGASGGIDIPALLNLAIVLVVVFFPLLLKRRGPPGPSDSDSDDGWGGSRPPRTPPDDPPGGIPLDDAQPARVRLRGQARLADLIPTRERRPSREPDRRPARRPTPVGR